MPVDIAKIQQEAPGLVDLTKKASVSIEKAGLAGHTAAVIMTADVSPSARGLYDSGAMQAAMEVGVAVALTFDDDGRVPASVFDGRTYECDDITLQNYAGYLNRNHPNWTSGTGYANAIRWCRDQAGQPADTKKRKWFGQADTLTASMPTYAIFFTDGEPTDSRRDIERELAKLENDPLFIQFVGVGPGIGTRQQPRFPYLEQLDGIFGCGFFAVGDPLSITEETMLDKLMFEYPTWVTQARSRGLIH